MGEVSRGGLTRGDYKAWDHDRGLQEKYTPFGIVEEDGGQLHITFGSSSKTSDFIVDALEAWWAALEETAQVAMARLQIKMDNGPESSGIRTQFLHRMVQFADQIGKPAIRVPSRSENSRSQAVQRSRSMCLCVPVHDRCTILPAPAWLKRAHCGFGHENRVYLSCAGVVCVIVVLL